MTTLAQILDELRPGAEWSLVGDSYEGLTWLDDEQSKPTAEEIEAARPSLEVTIESRDLREQRRQAFQIEADPLYFKVQRGEANEEEWLAKVAEIRARYPYPDGPAVD